MICTSCGVNLQNVAAALSRLQDRQREQSAEDAQRFEQQSAEQVVQEVTTARHVLFTQLRFLLLVASILIVIIGSIAMILGYQARLRRERLAAQYQAALQCSKNQDYACAAQLLEQLLQEQANYPEAVHHLVEARLELAKQAIQTKQWQKAIQQLELLLMQAPKNDKAFSLLQVAYDGWYKEALMHGDYWLAVQINIKKQINLPKQEEK